MPPCGWAAAHVTERLLPDKAVDLIDEAASKVRIESQMLPPELQYEASRLRRLEDEEQAASQCADYQRAAELRAERLRLQQEFERVQVGVGPRRWRREYGRRGGDRRAGLDLDGHTRGQAARKRGREAGAHGGAAARPRHRPGRRHRGGVRRHTPREGGPERSRTALMAASYSSDPPAWARRSWRGRWPSTCSTTRRTWCA